MSEADARLIASAPRLQTEHVALLAAAYLAQECDLSRAAHNAIRFAIAEAEATS